MAKRKKSSKTYDPNNSIFKYICTQLFITQDNKVQIINSTVYFSNLNLSHVSFNFLFIMSFRSYSVHTDLRIENDQRVKNSWQPLQNCYSINLKIANLRRSGSVEKTKQKKPQHRKSSITN